MFNVYKKKQTFSLNSTSLAKFSLKIKKWSGDAGMGIKWSKYLSVCLQINRFDWTISFQAVVYLKIILPLRRPSYVVVLSEALGGKEMPFT